MDSSQFTLADPDNCFGRPHVVEWNGSKRFVCDRTGCLATKGVTFRDPKTGGVKGFFINEATAMETKAGSEKYKDKDMDVQDLSIEEYTRKRSPSPNSSANGAARQPKPTYHAFHAVKSGKVMDTEYLGKCTDPIAVIASKLRDGTVADDQKFTLTLGALSKGNAIKVSKTAAGPWVIITDTFSLPAGTTDEFKLEDSVMEHKKLKSGKGGKAAANASINAQAKATSKPSMIDLTEDDDEPVKKPAKKRARKDADKEILKAKIEKATKTPNASPKKPRAKPKAKPKASKPANDVTPPVSGDDE